MVENLGIKFRVMGLGFGASDFEVLRVVTCSCGMGQKGTPLIDPIQRKSPYSRTCKGG